jgi:hypothetical protein
MTRLNQLAPHSTMAGRRRARGAAHDPAREARTRRSLDGVFASYIRELSAAGDTTPTPGREPRGSYRPER